MTKVKTEIMLTTKDNPYDPFEQFDQWFAFDCEKQYFTCSFVERVAQQNNSNDLSTKLTEAQFDEAIKQIVYYQPEIYSIVSRVVEFDDSTFQE